MKRRGLSIQPTARPRWLVCVVAALTIVAVCAGAANGQSDADGAAHPDEGLYSLTQRGMGQTQARRYLALAHRAQDVERSIREITGARYGAVWLDPEGLRLHVGIRRSSDGGTLRARVEALLERRGLLDESHIVEVPWSERDLEEIQAEISRELDDLMRAGLLFTGLGPQSVVVTVAAGIDVDSLARVEKTIAPFKGAVEIERSEEPSLRIKPEACQAAAFCDLPLRGGVRIGASRTCTAGFNVRSRSDGKYFVLTAGHCVSDDAGTWYTRTSNGTLQPIGIRHSWVQGAAGDAALVRNWTGYWIGPPAPTASILIPYSPDTPNFNTDYGIGGVASNTLYSPVCLTSGHPTVTGWYSSCGQIIQTGVQAYNENGLLVSRLVRATYCGGPGASGGPVFKNNRAYGTHVGSSGACDVVYQSAFNSQDALNVNIMTR